MNTLIIVFTLLMCVGVIWFVPGQGPGALAVCAVVSLPTLFILIRTQDERRFLLRLFVIALMGRVVLATAINVADWEAFFGGDAHTYDIFGKSLLQSWYGDVYHSARYAGFIKSGAGAWGMLYVVAAVYAVIGENLYAIQLINASVGAATAIVVYYVAQTLFGNIRVSRLAALLVAFFPSLILWTSQALKDGLIILALALAMLATLRLMEKITIGYVFVLTTCLLALLSLRFYIFYMMLAAVVGSFFIGMKAINTQGFIQRFMAVAVMGLAFTWF
ncbi:MAG TPA: glycosyltransferase family 39 protein, partial [Pyrinomonadaceae bacterium]|nr:glycosyltransferase family 39 protein [Pyrinomonadaceae bacterium]